ncbi:MAG: ComEC/Rec2 family competence protein [Patescibacteria group bacterium]
MHQLFRREWPRVFVLCTLLVLCILVARTPQNGSGRLVVSLLDVGQGEAIFIQTPNGRQVLIDGGPNASVLEELGAVMPVGDRTLDLVVLTHAHSDHVSGLVHVLERYAVSGILESGAPYTTGVYRAWRDAVAQEGAVAVQALPGRRILLDADTALTVYAPNPTRALAEKNPNNASVMLMLQHGAVRMLLTGDAEAPVEQRLVSQGAQLVADILKVGHQGSRTSSTLPFLMRVAPRVAIMSVGEGNTYGHPHRVVTERLANLSIPYYRTDVDGRITIESDGTSFAVRAHK